ncbi:MAG TPA: hypothetical protein PLK46_12240 [Propioniciclava sp.]|uniref:hypothetical protein n=1 Tax=Propioniciclava sp. TaxID=2038686 RepID=UPI002CE495F5|nr:hypothetical protein [Propioniciclava sp.]HRL48223.1 hypothetical protein [Propioniciclava sp.]HRL81085.1 hypothetical protein [Propioniciclava sp.]
MVMVALAAATGCASVPVAPTPYPTLRAEPAYQCRPADGGDRVPCTAEEFEVARQRDALFEEAYDVFERYLLELDRLRRVGAGELSPEMESLVTGSDREALAQALSEVTSRPMIEGGVDLAWMTRDTTSEPVDGSLVQIVACVDYSGARYQNPRGGEPFQGSRAYMWPAYARSESGSLQIIDLVVDPVESCA